ncbi:hypothetical protein ACWT_3354 [Actinoplanes sp. SE50]|uniref:hypothetical protein n=1 Tax=unclassified Actinoplanes TaxID=2626549 RepID=UPI00023ED06F|nr:MULTISPECIES: hypothetical protein [unclassified Actinoplanes]AEV84377.1 hypothetical protein ACPL_3482 [Actinoplanes sp. SE50/110]ATO82769.1 hypothetical protein ACWT_3354 [Actinoplanes sp. SE50]SLM00176.1 hypothetical protein ACSP50_3408 [Actinoplanes sp. SE50/110]
MLAIVWESSFLDRLRRQQRLTRREDPHTGVRFWTKPRVRLWTITVVSTAVLELGLIALVLANVVPDALAARVVVLVGLAVVLATILTRAVVDIMGATRHAAPALSVQRDTAGHGQGMTSAKDESSRRRDRAERTSD